MKNILVVAPHPDDETLGCGGTLLRHLHEGDAVHWLIFTGMSDVFPQEVVAARKRDIETVNLLYNFASVHALDFPSTRLDTVPMGKLISSIKTVFDHVNPSVIYLPYRGDVHTDHKIVFDTVISCTKWFRCPSIKRILAYQTLSETEFGINPDANGFRPNVFVDICEYVEKKNEIIDVYTTELGSFPFPRSHEAIQALAVLHGATAGCEAAEAFMLLKEII